MPTMEALKERAMRETRESLAASPTFRTMPFPEQKDLFRDLYNKRLTSLGGGAAVSTGPARAMNVVNNVSRAIAGGENASNLIDPNRHRNSRIDQAGDLAGGFIRDVDFPEFVKDLLQGVFDANLKVTVKQMQAYQELLKTATASVSKFVNAIDDTAAFGYLAENDSENFGLGLVDTDEEETLPDGTTRKKQNLALTDSSGEAADLSSNEVKAKIMEAKIQMAREHRAILRETILMGITRLVVERGVVRAACEFNIEANENIQLKDTAVIQSQLSAAGSYTGSSGFLGSIFGGGSSGMSASGRRTKITVSSAKSTQNTTMKAKVEGFVEIKFKSDYFKLDNFAQMYGMNAAGTGVNSGGAGATPPAPPAAPPAQQ